MSAKTNNSGQNHQDQLMGLLNEISNQKKSKSVIHLKDLIRLIRPKKVHDLEGGRDNFLGLIQILSAHPDLGLSLGEYLQSLLSDKNFIRLLSEAGIISNDPFLTLTKNIVFERIFPESYHQNDANYIFEKAFDHYADHLWICYISDLEWSRFFHLLGYQEISGHSLSSHILKHAINSIQVLSVHLSSLGFAPHIIRQLPELEAFDSPFMGQNREVSSFLENYLKEGFDRSDNSLDYKQIMVLLDQCDNYIKTIKKRKKIFGVSFKLTNYTLRLEQTLFRMKSLLHLIACTKDEFPFQQEIKLLKEIVRARKERLELRKHFKQHLELIAYQVTEHTGETGESYITTGFKDYFKMLMASSGGGVIVGVLTLVKLAITKMHLALLGQAVFYSLNYSLGFIIIHLTKTKLATKQPAMTASTLANALDLEKKENDEDHIEQIIQLIRQILRSQFVAFVGNVFAVIPVSYLLTKLLVNVIGLELVNSEIATKLITEIHPWQSASIFYAGLAGVYLFISGIITGYYDNLNIATNLAVRFRQQPLVQKMFTKNFIIKTSNYLDENIGQLAGNFFLGVFLGVTSTVGYILGLPLDIRHITFAAGNLGIALATIGSTLSWYDIFISFLGIGLIGFMNFIVSFGLSIIVAIKSRGINLDYNKTLIKKSLILFIKAPHTFFIPTKGA